MRVVIPSALVAILVVTLLTALSWDRLNSPESSPTPADIVQVVPAATVIPTAQPTILPTNTPVEEPTPTPAPTEAPTIPPTSTPSLYPAPAEALGSMEGENIEVQLLGPVVPGGEVVIEAYLRNPTDAPIDPEFHLHTPDGWYPTSDGECVNSDRIFRLTGPAPLHGDPLPPSEGTYLWFGFEVPTSTVVGQTFPITLSVSDIGAMPTEIFTFTPQVQPTTTPGAVFWEGDVCD